MAPGAPAYVEADVPGHADQPRTRIDGRRFESPPREEALWHFRCPDSPEFTGTLPLVVGQARTVHWFDPCALLEPDARSEYRPEFRERQPGGGWQLKGCGTKRDPV